MQEQHIGAETRTQFINPINKSAPSCSQRVRVRVMGHALAIKGHSSNRAWIDELARTCHEMLLWTSFPQSFDSILDLLTKINWWASVTRHHRSPPGSVIDHHVNHHCATTDILEDFECCLVSGSFWLLEKD
jgi:hypothetical protein